MELHSYAKHRAAKKWSLEQKRRLVEARINCDLMFQSMPKISLLPWKKVIFQANLEDFNPVFVRKQWANMVAKYKQYKKERLGNRPTHDIDAETVRKITQEWEFFQPIHGYMTRKTTNLHSYALTTQQHADKVELDILEGQPAKKQQRQETFTSSNEHLNACSSDTNDDFASTINMPSSNKPNTDHDFYSKKIEQQFYFADVEEDTLESHKGEQIFNNNNANGFDIQSQNSDCILNGPQEIANQEIVPHVDVKETVTNPPTSRQTHKKTLTEREKYYRHKIRFHHRIEQRFDAILNVIGQIAKAEYPNIDVSPLTQAGSGLIKNVLNSDISNSSESGEDN